MIAESPRTPRERVLGRIADHLAARKPGHPLRVAVDGVTAAGKTTIARPVLHRIGGPADATVRLFSYGTMQLPTVQVEHFGRQLTGAPDALPGHRQDWITITDPAVLAASGTDRHPIVHPTGDPADITHGTVLTLTTEELAAADLYEVDDHHRTAARLASGTASWVCLEPHRLVGRSVPKT